MIWSVCVATTCDQSLSASYVMSGMIDLKIKQSHKKLSKLKFHLNDKLLSSELKLNSNIHSTPTQHKYRY